MISAASWVFQSCYTRLVSLLNPVPLAVRWCLGVAEAGLFPGVNYYLSCWYKRSEFGLRAALFFSAATASGAFGGLLAGM